MEAAKWVVGSDDTGVVKGRMKFCRPTFRAIAKVDKALAIETYTPNKSAFHPIAAKLIEKVSSLKLEEVFLMSDEKIYRILVSLDTIATSTTTTKGN